MEAPNKKAYKRKIKLKFAKKLILSALENDHWEQHEIGNLLSLLILQLHLHGSDDLYDFLKM